MARYNKYGFAIDQTICEDVALPNADHKALTNTVTLNSPQTGRLKVVICAASTTVALADAATMTITPLFGTSATTCTVRAMGAIYIVGGDVTLDNTQGEITSTDLPNPLSWTSGTLITEFYLPERLISDYDYMDINVACSGNESSEKIEAYLVVEG